MNNQKTTKRSLVAAGLVLLLCIAMLVGTTFAWFTDSASTAVNKIQAGTLDVALEMAIKSSDGTRIEWATAEGQTLSWQKAPSHESEEVLWEPGCTYNLNQFRIVNKGTLALKYKIIISGIVGDAKLLEAIDFTVTGVDGAATATALNGFEGKLAASSMTDAITISGHMKESAGNDYQGLSIDGIAITVVATQDTVEYDSLNNTYDENAQYPATSNAELENAITSATPGSTVALTSGTFNLPATSVGEGVTIAGGGASKTTLVTNQSDVSKDNVTIKDVTIKGTGAESTKGSLNISGDNTTIENVVYVGEAGKIAIAVSTSNDNEGTVIKDTKITNAFRGIQFWRLSGNSVIDSCVLDISGYTFNIDAVAPGATLMVKDSTLNGWTSYTSGIQLVTFDNCKFGLNTYEYLRPYSETVLTDCEFTSEDYQLNAGGSDTYTITLNNCTKNGTAITAGNVVSLLLDTDGWNSNAILIVNGVTVTV